MSSRRSSQSESTWSQQWESCSDKEGPSVSNVSTQAGDLVPVKKRNTSSSCRCAKIFGLVLLVVILIAGAFVGGYFLRRYTAEKDGLKYQTFTNSSWREGNCEQHDSSSASQYSQCGVGSQAKPTLLVISFSGLRPDFITKEETPALFRIKTCGVRSPFMRPVFPTNTFPNQYSIATGLYPKNHGIVDDVFRNREMDQIFDGKRGAAAQTNNPVWWKGEPIWETAKRQGKRAHVYHWAGSEVTGKKPDESVAYKSNTPLQDSFNKISSWMTDPVGQKAAIVMAFLDEPDTTGRTHKTGTKGREFIETLRRLDGAVDQLMQNLKSKNLLPCTNIIFVSDHGTEDSSCNANNVTNIMDILMRNIQPDFNLNINTENVEMFGGGHARLRLLTPQAPFPSGPGAFPTLREYMLPEALACDRKDNTGNTVNAYTLFNATTLPRRLHYDDVNRIEPILLTAKPGHSLWKSAAGAACGGVMHGSDNIYPHMNGVFLATGPSFRTGVGDVDAFSVVELYNLMCQLAGLTPAANDGTAGVLDEIVVAPTLPITATITVPDSGMTRPVFPANEEDVTARQGLCLDGCRGLMGGALKADLRLNISQFLAGQLTATMVPYGLPRTPANHPAALLVGRGLVTGFSLLWKSPLWTAVSLKANRKVSVPYSAVTVDCIRNDVRLPPDASLTCRDFEASSDGEQDARIQKAYLVPPVLAGDVSSDVTDAKTITNVVPMYPAFCSTVWVPLWNSIASAATGARGGNVFAGPIFDHTRPFGQPDSAGNMTFVPGFSAKVPLPSHYYLIATRYPDANICTSGPSKCSAYEEVLAFILPHVWQQNQIACHNSFADYLLTYTATVVDVERLTGLQFFRDIVNPARLRMALPTRLWW